MKGKERRRYEHNFPFQYNHIATVDNEDNLWYLSKYWGNGRFDGHQRGKIYQIGPTGVEKEFLLDNTALPPRAVNLDIYSDINGGFWRNPDQGDFWYCAGNSFQGFHPSSGWYDELADTYKDLAHTNTIYFDKQGRTWVGTEFGAYLINVSKNPFQSIAHDNTGKKSSAFRGITEDFQQTLWACIDNGVGWLGRFFPKGKGYEAQITERDKKGWGAGYKYGIFTDSKGLVWFGSGEDSSIIRYNPVDSSYHTLVYHIPKKSAVQQVNVWSFFEEENGRVWFGTDAGVIGRVSTELSISTLPELEGVNAKGGCIYQFCPDKKGNIWVATDDGMFQLDAGKKTIKPYRPDGFPFLKEGIFHIHEDADGSLWLGTKGLGLVHWQPEKGIYQQFTKADGLSNNTIYAVYEDDFGNLWLPSDYGIMQFNKSTHRTRAYLEEDGIANQEFNRISHYKGRDGKLYFGGLNGITTFHPKYLAGDSLAANIPLVLTGFEQFDGDENKLVDKTVALRVSNTIALQPADRFFRLEFALLTFDKATNIQYGYLVEGVDKDWTYQKENSIRFSRLPYGRHLLRIKGQASNGQWSENELAIEVVVLKPLYLQTWFLTLVVFSLSAGIFCFYKWRVRKLQAQRDELERVVVERTRQITEDKAIIEQQAEALKSLEKLKSRFFANVSHELRTPLTLIIGPVNSLLKQKEQDNPEKKLLEFIRRNVQQLQKLINEILDLSKLEDNKLEVVEEPVPFYPYLKEQMAQFQSAAMSNELKFQLKFHANKSLQILLDKGKFEKIVHNFLSNAMKFSGKGDTVSLAVEELGDQLQISVADTGRGIHPDDQPHVFDRFYQSARLDAPTEGGTGIGLSLVKELAELLGGETWMESEWGKGSVFYFKFPKKLVGNEQLALGSRQPIDAGEQELARVPKPVEFANPTVVQPASLATILVVEDNTDLRDYLQFLLSEYQVTTAENGQAALDHLLQAPKCQLIISDLMMPVMDGFQLLEKLKADDRWRHIPVIMLTAKVNIQAKLNALRIGVDDYLTKPFQEEELKARIENLLRNYRERMEIFSQSQPETTENAAPGKPVIAAVDAEWLKEMEAVFTKHLSDNRLTVDFAADKLNLSERQFHRRIKQLTGLTPNHYLQEIRLQRAKGMLIEGRFATIKETAFAVGFQDVRYFSDLFEKHFGTKPSEARK